MDFPTSNYIVFCQACFVFPFKFTKLGFSKKKKLWNRCNRRNRLFQNQSTQFGFYVIKKLHMKFCFYVIKMSAADVACKYCKLYSDTDTLFYSIVFVMILAIIIVLIIISSALCCPVECNNCCQSEYVYYDDSIPWLTPGLCLWLSSGLNIIVKIIKISLMSV